MTAAEVIKVLRALCEESRELALFVTDSPLARERDEALAQAVVTRARVVESSVIPQLGALVTAKDPRVLDALNDLDRATRQVREALATKR